MPPVPRQPSAPPGATGPRRRGRLDRDTILAVAQELVAEGGIEALSMRRLGAALGADPTALYRHFRNKDELLVELADRSFQAAPALDPDADWRLRLRAELRHERGRYLVHPELATLLARQPDDAQHLVRMNERVLGLLAEAGLDPAAAGRLFHVIENAVVGSGLYATLLASAEDPRVADRAAMREAYANLDAAQLPHAVAAAGHLFPEQEAIFEATLDLLVASVEQAAAPAVRRSPPGRGRGRGRPAGG